MNNFLFITHRTEKYSWLQSAEIALKGGCKEIQLRMKGAALSEIEDAGKKLRKLCDEYNAGLFINDHVDICKKVNANGVHLGKTDTSPTEARRSLGNDFIIGCTANTFEDIEEAWKAKADYIGLGPFRFTHTKKNLSPVLGIDGYQSILSRCRAKNISLPVFAIGGITREDIPGLMHTGISGIALSSAILEASDPVNEIREIIRLIEKCKFNTQI